MILLQLEETIKQGKEVMGVGQNADVTTIGVMALFCLVCLGVAITVWRSKIKSDSDQKDLNKNTLEALVTANIIITNLETKVEYNNNSINELKLLISQLIGEIKGSK